MRLSGEVNKQRIVKKITRPIGQRCVIVLRNAIVVVVEVAVVAVVEVAAVVG